MNQGKSEESLGEPELRARIAAGSRDPEDYLELADLLKSGLGFREAMELYERSLNLNLSTIANARFAWELGNLLCVVEGRNTEATALAQRALSLLADESASRDVLLLRGLNHGLIARAVVESDDERARAEASRAVECLERVLAEYGVSEATAVAYLVLAWVYGFLGEPDKVIARSQAYLQCDIGPWERAVALDALAEAFRLTGRLPDAEEAMKHALSYSGRDLAMERPTMYVTLGLIQRALHKPVEARRSLEGALSALREAASHGDPDYLRERERDVYWYLAELHYETRNYREAASVLTKLLTEHPEDRDRHRALLWRGQCSANLGLPEQARRDYERVLTSPAASDEERAAANEGLADLPPASA